MPDLCKPNLMLELNSWLPSLIDSDPIFTKLKETYTMTFYDTYGPVDPPIKFIVCGGRDFADIKHKFGTEKLEAKKQRSFVFDKLDGLASIYSKHSPDNATVLNMPIDANANDTSVLIDANWLPLDIKVVSGGARGVDTVAIDWAVSNYCQYREYLADWKRHKNAAGPIRNQLILDSEVPKAGYDENYKTIIDDAERIKNTHVIAFPGGKGTADMVRRSKARGLHVIEFSMHDYTDWRKLWTQG